MIGHPLKVRELVEEIARGEILLPEFQRAYVWKPSQVVKLIDSLYREYPVGQILLWDTQEAPSTRALEGVTPGALASVGRPKIVLDGQQRLTSLYKALARDVKEPVDVCFHLETEAFRPKQRRMGKDPRWVSVRAVVNQEVHDLEILQAIAQEGGLDLKSPACRQHLERLRRLRRIEEYAFPIEIFRVDDFEAVTELFVRANSGGTRLRQAELVLAQLALRLPGNIVRRFEEAMARYEPQGFPFDPRFLVRALVAVGTGQSRFRHLNKLWQQTPAELDALWARTRQALDRAVRFVRQNARWPSAAWVPSLNALVPLVAFFEKEPDLARDVEVGLLRWLYVVMLRGRYSSSPEAALDQDLKALEEKRPVVALLKLAIDAAGDLAVTADEVGEADRGSALVSLAFALARKRRAKDWFTGVELGGEGNAPQVASRPIFSGPHLEASGLDRSAKDELANLAFFAGPPPRDLAGKPPAEMLERVLAADKARLEAQCIPLDRALWQPDRFREFLAARRALIADALNEMLDDPA